MSLGLQELYDFPETFPQLCMYFYCSLVLCSEKDFVDAESTPWSYIILGVSPALWW